MLPWVSSHVAMDRFSILLWVSSHVAMGEFTCCYGQVQHVAMGEFTCYCGQVQHVAMGEFTHCYGQVSMLISVSLPLATPYTTLFILTWISQNLMVSSEPAVTSSPGMKQLKERSVERCREERRGGMGEGGKKMVDRKKNGL